MSKSNNIIMNLKGVTLWCVWLFLLEVSLAGVRKYKFDVEYINGEPYCVKQVVIGINGHFPGPTITAEEGDTLHIILTNKLSTQGIVLHWHGIRQYGTPWADGTASISQCAIAPGQTFHYRFTAERAGAYFYHGHDGFQKLEGVNGALIVRSREKKEAFDYDGEFNLLLSDWWQKNTHQPQSLLMNGRGQYNCSMAANVMNTSLPQCKFRGNEKCAPQIFYVHPNKTYRLRIASATSSTSLNLAIGEHKMVVVEADGNYVQPFTTDNIHIHSGETYSVLITTNQSPNTNYWISVSVTGGETTPQALAILNYRKNKNPNNTLLPTSPPPLKPQFGGYNLTKAFTHKILALKGTTPQPPHYYNRRLHFLITENLVDGHQKYAINNISLVLPLTPYLAAIKYKINGAFDQNPPPDNFSADYDIFARPSNPNAKSGNGVYTFELDDVVDVVLQNGVSLNERNMSEMSLHPWHLHGHEFWVLGYGEGKFEEGDERKLNLRNPPLRNTVVVFPYGWSALRFRADNPGVWAFHCHIEGHFEMGMGVVFAEGVEHVKGIPRDAMGCGLTRNI